MRILIVEDEKKLALSIKRGLEQQSYAVDAVFDGEDGLSMATDEPYDLIILDRMLPNLEGAELVKKLRERNIVTPVLMPTAKSSVLERAYGLNAGADDYLVKPFAFVELIARVRALLRRPKSSKSNIQKYGDLTLDVENKSVIRAGQIIDLTAKEFALLEYLMQKPGKLYAKETLIKHVWDYDADVLPNTVEVYIGYLRNKIDKPFKSKALINTKRGFGYYFGENLENTWTFLKLAGFYLGIMLISIFFSVSIYQLSIQEIARGYRRQSALIDNFPNFPIPADLHDQIQLQRKLEYDYAKEQVFSRLVLVNVFILVGGGMVSYFFARRTIKPIEEAREAQSRFTADASHELRTPLAVMQSETEVALMDPELSLKSAKDVLESNLEEVQRLSALSENLLELAQIGSIDFTHEKIPTSEIVDAAIKSLEPLAKDKKIKLALTNNPVSTITGDKTRLIEALSILIANAIKYSPQNSTIQITSLAKKKFIEVAVRDQGIGIDPKELPKLFDRFYRSDSARTKDGVGGFGLGLAIAKEIAEIHGGSINVISTKGKGSTFSLIIPKEKIS